MDSQFSAIYEEIYRKLLAEPQNEQDVKDILECIQTRHGNLSGKDENLLQSADEVLYRRMSMMARSSRKYLAQFTKA